MLPHRPLPVGLLSCEANCPVALYENSQKKQKNSTPPIRVMKLQHSTLVSMIEYPAGWRSGKSEQQFFLENIPALLICQGRSG